MLTLASSFLYALLTNRVLLIHETTDLVDLFCEPFPETSWVLPSDFPVKELTKLHLGSAQSYGNMLKNKVIGVDLKASAESLPSYVYLHLEHDYRHLDRLFFCEDDQFVLRKVNWLVLQSDIYFVPSLFLVPQFEDELRRLFPNRETVFHHLGRYLFHPSNAVWGMIVRYYESYLAKAEERIGLQVRTFSRTPISFGNFSEQIISCSRQENILPRIDFEKLQPSSSKGGRLKAVLITSLYSDYYEKMKNMYYEHPTTTGEVISIYQPSHEEQQHTEKQSHNQKALAEIYLLGLCDVLVTSGWSTFGYVAQGLAGLKPWILLSPRNGKAPDPPCVRAMSMEPCFHTPPDFDCKAKKYVDMGTMVRHIRHCEDVGRGVKLTRRDRVGSARRGCGAMDMKRFRRPQQPTFPARRGEPAHGAANERKLGAGIPRLGLLLVACLMLLPLLVVVVVSGARRRTYPEPIIGAGGAGEGSELDGRVRNGSEDGFSTTSKIQRDRLLGGLLSAGFDEESCLSRYQSVLYRKDTGRLPSAYLVEKLREHEALQRKCGPNTVYYKKALKQLKSGQGIETTDCNYLVWISYNGLGNRILTGASAFLYALLTNRVLLIDRGADMANLFCEPFPGTSWLLPLDFPVDQFRGFNISTPTSYGNMVKNKLINNNAGHSTVESLPAYIYLHLDHDYGDYDKLFFCEDDQKVLEKIPWLILHSDNYFVPALFLIPSYEDELHRLFLRRILFSIIWAVIFITQPIGFGA
uniref:Fucosyltransferase n=1 Tax=Ananas comosus var. bracteatus TaxID=296719 RepID=A0A6V7P624_ANACO|nr:unnamed protein product [Ananas comosus var. bracteatus]